jgi:hypothetical protein
MSENAKPKNRIEATGQTDQVMDLFWMRSIPMKKRERMHITAMPYHHFFLPFSIVSSAMVILYIHVGNGMYKNPAGCKKDNRGGFRYFPGPFFLTKDITDETGNERSQNGSGTGVHGQCDEKDVL